MTFIDLSDAEGMFGLFVELVADERAACRDDPERLLFLDDLFMALTAMARDVPRIQVAATRQRLEELRESADPAFAGDRVIDHLDDLVDELENVGRS